MIFGWTIRAVEAAGEHVYRSGAVAADHRAASEAGAEILRRGGNAVDAAVATSFTLSVVRPYSCGIGGGGFMLIYIPGRDGDPPKITAINYRETAPAAVGPDYFVNLEDPTASRFGHRAVGVPGTVAGLCHALEKYGTLDLATVLAPAIRAAEEGVPADANFVSAARELAQTRREHPHAMDMSAAIWRDLCLDGEIKIGDVIRQPEKAKALRLIAEQGPRAFYEGEIARAIVASMQAHGGVITLDDLSRYRVDESSPLQGRFLDFTIFSMPPPSSGGIAMQQIFAIVERLRNRGETVVFGSPDSLHLLAEAMKHAFADRSRWLGDPQFVSVPVERLLAPAYLDQLADSILLERIAPPHRYGAIALPEDGGTSHFSVIDANGMAVACTETINLNYGSLVTVPGFGIILNNEMDDFTTIPDQPNAFGLRQSELNLPEPGKRPLSSMSPTIVVKDGRAVLLAGGSGGPRIISATTQVILNCLLFDMLPRHAVKAPRLHHQWMPNELRLERGLFDDQALVQALEGRGHRVTQMGVIGQVQVIHVREDGIHAASDPRKGGAPAGH